MAKVIQQKKKSVHFDGTRLLLGIVMIPLAASCVLALGSPRLSDVGNRPEEQRPVAVRAVLATDRDEADEDFWLPPADRFGGEHHRLHKPGAAAPAMAATVGVPALQRCGPQVDFIAPLRGELVSDRNPVRGPPPSYEI